MRFWLIGLFSILIAQTAHAINYYGGAGLSWGQLAVSQSGQSANFGSYSNFLEAGAETIFSNNFGFSFSGEYGNQQAQDNASQSSYVEDGINNFWSGKFGLIFGQLTVGGGVQDYDLSIKSYSGGTGYLENTYSGNIPVYFIDYALSPRADKGMYCRTVVEASDAIGTIHTLSINDLSISLNLQFVFGSE